MSIIQSLQKLGRNLKGKSNQKIEFLKKVFSNRKYFYEHVLKISGRYRNRKSFKSYVKNRYFPRVAGTRKKYRVLKIV